MIRGDPEVERAFGGDGGPYRHLVEHIQDAVVEFELVEEEPVVRNVNRAFVNVFGYGHEEVHGEPLNEWIVPGWLADEARELDARTASGEINYQRVRRETADGLREFLYRGIPYEDGTAETDGFAVYTDLTDITRNERRLKVMNRVLRHNLRNTAGIVVAHTTRLLNELQDQSGRTTRIAATIERAASNLQDLTEEATDIQAVLRSRDDGSSVVDCVPIVGEVVEEHRQLSPTAAIETELPASMTVNGTSKLRFAVDSLLDNAIEHNPADTPWVRIRVAGADTDGWARIDVDDDGPVIPATEREVITGEADITPTRHGSGLGLWLAKWTAESYGGELRFGTNEHGGNTVSIRLPRR